MSACCENQVVHGVRPGHGAEAGAETLRKLPQDVFGILFTAIDNLDALGRPPEGKVDIFRKGAFLRGGGAAQEHGTLQLQFPCRLLVREAGMLLDSIEAARDRIQDGVQGRSGSPFDIDREFRTAFPRKRETSLGVRTPDRKGYSESRTEHDVLGVRQALPQGFKTVLRDGDREKRPARPAWGLAQDIRDDLGFQLRSRSEVFDEPLAVLPAHGLCWGTRLCHVSSVSLSYVGGKQATTCRKRISESR